MGCSIVEIKPLPENLREPVFWHIDSFEREEDARARVRPASFAFEAHVSWWLMTIESPPSGHDGGAPISREAFTAAATAEIFDACYRCLCTIQNDLAGSLALRRRSILRRGGRAMPGNSGTRIQNEERRDPGGSDRGDDAFGCQRVQTAPRIRGHRLRFIETSDNVDAHRNGIATCFV
jgi:hypothetical protein